MNRHSQIRHTLQAIEQSMRDLMLWQTTPPSIDVFSSTAPFCLDTLCAEQWLQWVLLPKMFNLLDTNAALPARFEIAPYFEETLQDKEPNCALLLELLRQLDALLKNAV